MGLLGAHAQTADPVAPADATANNGGAGTAADADATADGRFGPRILAGGAAAMAFLDAATVQAIAGTLNNHFAFKTGSYFSNQQPIAMLATLYDISPSADDTAAAITPTVGMLDLKGTLAGAVTLPPDYATNAAAWSDIVMDHTSLSVRTPTEIFTYPPHYVPIGTNVPVSVGSTSQYATTRLGDQWTVGIDAVAVGPGGTVTVYGMTLALPLDIHAAEGEVVLAVLIRPYT